jgi:hypothetical protein
MKAKLLILPVTVLFVLFTACKKDKQEAINQDEISLHSDDQSRFSSEIDASANDANLMLESMGSFSGRSEQIQNLICDASVSLDTMANPRTITITYNGANCQGNRSRTGAVIISVAQGVRWRNAGAAVTLTFQNFKITRNSDNKSITINGSQTYTNVSGGLIYTLAGGGSITHRISSNNMSVKFDNELQRTWQVAKQRVFTYDDGIVITNTGTHTEGVTSNIAEWGVNRFGNSFITSTFAPVVVRQDCNFRITSGEVRHVTQFVHSSVIFGLNANGTPTNCPGNGNYYMKISWTGAAGNVYTAILPY